MTPCILVYRCYVGLLQHVLFTPGVDSAGSGLLGAVGWWGWVCGGRTVYLLIYATHHNVMFGYAIARLFIAPVQQ